MENQVKVDDTIFWWGDYYDGFNTDGTVKTKYLSGVNKVVKTGSISVNLEGFVLDNDKIFFLEHEHKEWELVKPNDTERCVMCGQETPYSFETSICVREYYVEGCGQLCEQCYNNIYDK